MNVFIHIPKTGGSTFVTILDRNYKTFQLDPNQEITRKTERKWIEKKAEFIHGHVPMARFEKGHIGTVTFLRAVTFLRDPVERTLSWYFHDVERLDLEYPIKEWLWDTLRKTPRNGPNAMTWYLSGDGTVQSAKDCLRFYVSVGITEYFDLSLKLFRKARILKDISYYKQNVTAHPRRHIYQNDTQTRNLIRDMNYKDTELYDYGKKLFFECLSFQNSGGPL
jgi:hypothetical protein